MHELIVRLIASGMILCLIVTVMAGSGAAVGLVEVEPNDDETLANPIQLGDTIGGQMSDYDQDFYAIDVYNQESMIIETNVGTGADIQVSVYDPSWTHVKHWVQASGNDGEMIVSTPADGTYYIRVYTGQYANLVTNYSIAVSAPPFNWEALGVAVAVLGLVISGMVGGIVWMYRLVRRRRRKPSPATAASKP